MRIRKIGLPGATPVYISCVAAPDEVMKNGTIHDNFWVDCPVNSDIVTLYPKNRWIDIEKAVNRPSFIPSKSRREGLSEQDTFAQEVVEYTVETVRAEIAKIVEDEFKRCFIKHSMVSD